MEAGKQKIPGPIGDPNSSQPIWKKVLEKITTPPEKELDPEAMDYFREIVRQNQKSEKERMKRKRSKQIKKKKKMERTQGHVSIGLSTSFPTSNQHKSQTFLNFHSIPTETWKSNKTTLSKKPSTDEIHYQRSLLEKVEPSHFSAQTREQDALRKYKESKKRRISQLYSGDGVYHHALSTIWDHLDYNRFHEKIDKETRKNFPLTPEIFKKIERIRKRNEKIERKKEQEKTNPGVLRKVRRFFHHKFLETNFGYVFKTTPRYSSMTPVIPIHCRRCRYTLEYTLEPRWTPLGVTFAILFPIVGILCCIANREFVCVVCDEIYLYGDYPSRCRPLDKDKINKDEDDKGANRARMKRRSFKRTTF